MESQLNQFKSLCKSSRIDVPDKSGIIVYSICGQENNPGDIEIRSTVYDWLASTTKPLAIFQGIMSFGYINMFGKRKGDTWLSSPLTYQLYLFWAFFARKKIYFIDAPGPSLINPGIGMILKVSVKLMNILICKASQGRYIVIGKSYQRGTNGSRACEQLVKFSISLADVVYVRDITSEEELKRFSNVIILPDVAMYNFGSSGLQIRTIKFIAISLRAEPENETLNLLELLSAINDAGLQPIFVAQARIDDKITSEQAEKYKCKQSLWGDNTHHERKRILDDIYSQSQAVISDRLHALVFGICHNAAPIPLLIKQSLEKKIVPTLSVFSSVTSSITSKDIERQDRSFFSSLIKNSIAENKNNLDKYLFAKSVLEKAKENVIELIEDD